MKLLDKLKSHKGETLTETLVGILIIGLSSAMLAGMIAAASRINSAADKADAALYAAVTSAEKGEKIRDITVTVYVSGIGQKFDANLCGDDETGLYSYRYEGGTTP